MKKMWFALIFLLAGNLINTSENNYKLQSIDKKLILLTAHEQQQPI
jgi:hypothetical protein